MNTVVPEQKKKPRKKAKKRNIPLLIVIGVLVIAAIFAIIKLTYKPAQSAGSTPSIGASTLTLLPSGSPTCPVNLQLATPVGMKTPTRLIVIVYDPSVVPNPGLDLANGQRLSDVAQFVSNIIPDIVGPGDEISVFQLGYDTYTAARVTRQYSYLSFYPQLYVAPSLTTFTPLPPTGVPTPGYGEVATQNAFRIVSTERAAAESANLANYNCQVQYYNENIKGTATAWQETQVADISNISTAAVNDFTTVTPAKRVSSELSYGGLYYGLYFASVDIKSDCANYDECDLVLVDDLHVYRRNNPEHLPIALNGVNLYVVQADCRDLNQPDCADLQTYWTPQFQGFGVSNIQYWNGVRAEFNLLGKFGR